MSNSDVSKPAADQKAQDTGVRYDFTINRVESNVIPILLWTTFAFFVLSIGAHWLAKYLGWQFGDVIAEWMFNTFGGDPGKLISEPWRLVTHMFMHGGLLHFAFNMLMLHMFYKSAREFFPGKTWLIVYFAAGIAGGLAYCLLNEPGKLMVGASGGVMGLWGAAIAARLRYMRVPADERPWQCDFPLKKLLAFLVLQFATEFLIPQVAHSAHLGGLVVGMAVGFLLPLCQQPRIVASRNGLFTVAAEISKSRLGRMLSSITLTPLEGFDKDRDFAAVEYDRVDWLNRRTMWYEALIGKVPEKVSLDQVVFVASARRLGSETADEVVARMLKQAGKEVPAEEKTKSSTSYTLTAAMVVFLLLCQVTVPAPWLSPLLVFSALLAWLLWFTGFKGAIGTVRKPVRLGLVTAGLVVAVFGGVYAIGFLCDAVDTAVLLLVSLVAGQVLQRFVIGPLLSRFSRGPEVA